MGDGTIESCGQVNPAVPYRTVSQNQNYPVIDDTFGLFKMQLLPCKVHINCAKCIIMVFNDPQTLCIIKNDLWIYILYYLQSEGFSILLSCIYWKDISFVLGVCDSLGIIKLFYYSDLKNMPSIYIYIYNVWNGNLPHWGIVTHLCSVEHQWVDGHKSNIL